MSAPNTHAIEIASTLPSWLTDPTRAAEGSVFSRRYHAIVANPPYIVAPNKAANDAYRARYVSAYMKFGMGAPFTERMFELAEPDAYIAQITSNAFMKREYGKALVEKVLPRFDLPLIIDTSGAYIPGHGTPTVIMVHRNGPPTERKTRVISHRRGESETPKDHIGHVWTSILKALGVPAHEIDVAPHGPNPIGLAWAKALAKLARALCKDVLATGWGGRWKGVHPPDEVTAQAGAIAAAWITGTAALQGFNQRRAVYEGSALPDAEHLGRSFERVAGELPEGAWWDPDAGINPCWSNHSDTDAEGARYVLSDAWSERVRREVSAVVRLDAIPPEQQGRTDWMGDLYQGLDDAAVSEHAFCQTPWFVGRLLVSLSVECALETFGPHATVLDPACGTGHLLCEAFKRLYLRRADPEDGGPEHTYPTCARMALAQISGADLNPVAAALCRWRLMLAYLDASMPRHFGLVPDDLPIQIETADALLAERPAGLPEWARPPKVEKAAKAPKSEKPVETQPSPIPAPAPERIESAKPRPQLDLFGGGT